MEKMNKLIFMYNNKRGVGKCRPAVRCKVVAADFIDIINRPRDIERSVLDMAFGHMIDVSFNWLHCRAGTLPEFFVLPPLMGHSEQASSPFR